MRKINHIVIATLLVAIVLPLFVNPVVSFAQVQPTQAQIDEVNAAEQSASGGSSSLTYPFTLSNGLLYYGGMVYTQAQYDAAEKSGAETDFGITCWKLFPPKLDVGGCVALVGYYVFWWPAAGVLSVAAAIFDTSAAWTFNNDILKDSFTASAWGTVRDIANLGLILALLYIAIATILQIGGVQLKKAVASVIIVALLINFSFFITRVVIDASNILALSLYGKIVANASPATGIGPDTIGSENTSVLQISSRLTAAFNPQRLLTKEVVTKWKEDNSLGLASVFWVFLFAGIVGFIAAYAFLKAALLLIARMVMFVFLVVSSPLAFVAWALPGGGGGFDKRWWSTLVDQALVAPVFFLFLYVITTVYRNNLLDGVLGTAVKQGMWAFLANIALHFVVIIVALLIAVSVTTKLAGAAGRYATAVGGAVVGGAVLGGGAMLARNTIGRYAANRAERLQNSQWAQNNPTLGRWTKAGLDATAGATFDARGIKGLDGLGKPSKDGYAGGAKRLRESKEKYAKFVVGGKRGDVPVTQEQFAKYGTDEEKKFHQVRQTEYAAATKTHAEQMKVYEKEMAEHMQLPLSIRQDPRVKTPVKPKAPEQPTIPLNARERLAREYEKSKFRSTRLAAENARKGQTGEDANYKKFQAWQNSMDENKETPKEGGGETQKG